MRDLSSARWISIKGFLFLLLGLLSSSMLLLERPTWKVLLLLTIAIWASCRFYYFAFYVIEHYIDPNYKFSGLVSFVRYFLRKRKVLKAS
jgi:hypothetical protein